MSKSENASVPASPTSEFVPGSPASAKTGSASGPVIPSLDGIRALSFLVVFASHVGLGQIVPGVFGVTVFLFLSGFLITLLAEREWDRSGNMSVKRFIGRRAVRILPPLWILLLASSAITVWRLESFPTLPYLASQVFFFSNYRTLFWDDMVRLMGVGVLWSLAVEEHYYLVFPSLYRRFRRSVSDPRTRACWLLAICGLVLGWRVVLDLGFNASVDRISFATDTRFDSILFGSAFANIWTFWQKEGRPTIFTEAQSRLAAIVGGVGLLATLVFRNEVFRQTVRYSIQGLCLGPIFAYVIWYSKSVPGRVLNDKVLVYIGQRSYALYLFHVLFIELFKSLNGLDLRTNSFEVRPSFFGVVIPAFLSTVIAAELLYRFVERPMWPIRQRLR